jgi:ATP-dependent Clp protease adaptor protein ClpS
MSDDQQQTGPGRGDGLALQESRPKVRKPPLYKVVILNDDYTPMEFVVQVLQRFFGLSRDKATSIMLHVHTRGRGVAGVYTYEIAETKVVMVNDYAREHEHPLQCTLEEADG